MSSPGLLPAVVLAVLCLGRCGRSAPAEQGRVAIDPSSDSSSSSSSSSSSEDLQLLSSGADDREKRQLSAVQSRVLNFLKPLPVVDVTKEEDKYGNNGDKFNRIGRGLIGGVETISSMLTSALSFPVDTAKKLSRSATEMLNNIGGRIVGLQR